MSASFVLLSFAASCFALSAGLALDAGASRREALFLGAGPGLCALVALLFRPRSALLSRAFLLAALLGCTWVGVTRGPVTAQLPAVFGILACTTMLSVGLTRIRQSPRQAALLILIAGLALGGAGWLVLAGGPKEPLSALRVRPAVADPIAYRDPTRPGPEFIARIEEADPRGEWAALQERGATVISRRPATGEALGTLRLWLPASGRPEELAKRVDWLTTPLVHRGFAVRVVAWPPSGPSPLPKESAARQLPLPPADATITVGAAAGWFRLEQSRAPTQPAAHTREQALIMLGPLDLSSLYGVAWEALQTAPRLLLMLEGSHDPDQPGDREGSAAWHLLRSSSATTRVRHRFHRTDWSGLCALGAPSRPWWRARRVLASRRATRRTAVALVMAGLEATLFKNPQARAFVCEPSRAPQLLPALAWRSSVWLPDDQELPIDTLEGASVEVSQAGWSASLSHWLGYEGLMRLEIRASGPAVAPEQGPVRVRLSFRIPEGLDPYATHFAVDWVRRSLPEEESPERDAIGTPPLSWAFLVEPKDQPLVVARRRDPAELRPWWIQQRLPCLPFSEHLIQTTSTAHFPLPRRAPHTRWILEVRAYEAFEVKLLSPRTTRR